MERPPVSSSWRGLRKNCRHLQHRPVSQHNLHTAWSVVWSGMRFVLWPASRRTRLWRNGLNLNTYCGFLLYWHPPSSIECWLISTMAKNQLSTLCIAQDKDGGRWVKGWSLSDKNGTHGPKKVRYDGADGASAWKSSIRRFVSTEKAPTRAFSWLNESGYYRFHI